MAENKRESIEALEKEYTDEDGLVDYKRLYGRGGPLDCDDEMERRGCGITGDTGIVSPWNPFEYSGGDNEVRISEGSDRSVGTISVKIDVDVSEALTGLKAVQREAKAATRSLRELEATQRRSQAVDINDMRDVQGQDGNWGNSDYMCGLFNGLELASATLEGREPEYRPCKPQDAYKHRRALDGGSV